tara:strand:+ start:558 stop:719 length:162 start_codon:yes stop_codon:yes gene_type:complete
MISDMEWSKKNVIEYRAKDDIEAMEKYCTNLLLNTSFLIKKINAAKNIKREAK